MDNDIRKLEQRLDRCELFRNMSAVLFGLNSIKVRQALIDGYEDTGSHEKIEKVIEKMDQIIEGIEYIRDNI